MEEQYFQVEVKNIPHETLEYVVARFDESTNSLWYWGSWNVKETAAKVAEEIGGIVVRRVA